LIYLSTYQGSDPLIGYLLLRTSDADAITSDRSQAEVSRAVPLGDSERGFGGALGQGSHLDSRLF